MKALRVLLAVLLATGGWALAAPTALAGGWATTLLDPLPDRLEAGQTYTVGFWVLQHGSHPASPPVAEPGLKFTDEKRTAVTFKGAALPEPAHYAAAIVLPHDGAWQLEGLQGWFAPYKIGTLTVPGRLALEIPPPAIHVDGHGEHTWGAIHPPTMETGTLTGAAHTGHSHDAAPTQPPPAPSVAGTPGLLLAGTLGLLAGLALAIAGRRLAVRLRRPA